MKTMHLFRISYQDLGPNILLVPEVPHYRLDGEDGETPRVCACPTLYQCIMAKSMYLNSKLWKENKLNFYVYTADVPIEFIEQPTNSQVEDVWMTGELWVTQPIIWTKLEAYEITIGKQVSPHAHIYRYFVNPVPIDLGNGRVYTEKVDTGYHFALDGNSRAFTFTEGSPGKSMIQLIKEGKINYDR